MPSDMNTQTYTTTKLSPVCVCLPVSSVRCGVKPATHRNYKIFLHCKSIHPFVVMQLKDYKQSSQTRDLIFRSQFDSI